LRWVEQQFRATIAGYGYRWMPVGESLGAASKDNVISAGTRGAFKAWVPLSKFEAPLCLMFTGQDSIMLMLEAHN